MEDLAKLLRPHIQNIEMYSGAEPVEVLAARAGISPDKVIKLNGNENPYGPSPKVAEALGRFSSFSRYPDTEQRQLRERVSAYLGVDPQSLVMGNGSDEIIDLILRMCLEPGDSIIEPVPTFGMYRLSARISGGQVVEVARDASFAIDVDEMKRAIGPRTKVVFVTSPNNPTGNVTPDRDIRRLLDSGILVVVDETYYEFCGKTVLPLVQEYPNLIVLRTFSKWAGLAGLRVGMGIMSPEIAGRMLTIKPPYNVNVAAEVAVKATLEDLETLMDRVKAMVADRERLFSALERVPGIRPWPSEANFILCQFPTGRGKEVYDALAAKGIFLRYFSTPRLKDFVRISIGLPHEIDATIEALREVLADDDVVGVGSNRDKQRGLQKE